MRIQVTAEDIANGKPKVCDACPIARALKRAGMIDVEVQGDHVYARDTSADLPAEACNFVENFDGGYPVAPFEFDVEFNPYDPG